MADSIPKLRRLLNEAQEEIRELKARAAEVVERVVEVERIVEVERVVEVPVEVPVPFEVPVAMYPPSVQMIETDRIVYVESPELIETVRRLQARVIDLSDPEEAE